MHEFHRAKRVSLRGNADFSERALQAQIEKNPGLLGLGDVEVRGVERRQPQGGRLDLLLSEGQHDVARPHGWARIETPSGGDDSSQRPASRPAGRKRCSGSRRPLQAPSAGVRACSATSTRPSGSLRALTRHSRSSSGTGGAEGGASRVLIGVGSCVTTGAGHPALQSHPQPTTAARKAKGHRRSAPSRSLRLGADRVQKLAYVRLTERPP